MGPRVTDHLLEGHDRWCKGGTVQHSVIREHLESVEDLSPPGPPSVPGEQCQCWAMGMFSPAIKVRPSALLPHSSSAQAGGQPFPLLLHPVRKDLEPLCHCFGVDPSGPCFSCPFFRRASCRRYTEPLVPHGPRRKLCLQVGVLPA